MGQPAHFFQTTVRKEQRHKNFNVMDENLDKGVGAEYT